MSQLPTEPAPAQAAGKAKKPKSPAALILRISLLVILAVLAVALVFDRRARSACKKSYEDLDKMAVKGEFSRKDVLKKINGRKSQFEEKGNYARDTFRWRSGLLVRSFTIYVLYAKHKDDIGQVDTTKKGNEGWDLSEVSHNKEIEMPK